MNRHLFECGLLFLGFVLLLSGCMSSEETGAGDRANAPVQIFGPIDTTRRFVEQDAIIRTGTNSPKSVSGKSKRAAPKFKSKQDTLRASVVTKAKPSIRQHIKIERPKHPIFTVQVGAFSKASNALSVQKKAKKRFIHQPVDNNYLKTLKMYRVSIGRYKNQADAFALRDSIIKRYSKEYSQCWINFIR